MFQIDLMSRLPIYEQITEQTKRLILAGLLKPGDKLPSVRSLSATLSVNPNTIQRAYNDMFAKGIAVSIGGKGCFIAQDALEVLNNDAMQKLKTMETLVTDLKLAGIPEQTILEKIENVYANQEGNFHDSN